MSDSEAMPGTHDCGGDAAAFVLGALEPDEADAFTHHLEECAVCRDEVEALGGLVRALPMAAPQYPASKRLRRKLKRAIREEPKAGARSRATLRLGSSSGSRIALGGLVAAAVAVAAIVSGFALSSGGPAGRVIDARVTGIPGSAQLRVSQGRGELVVRHLAAPPAGHVYEVWLKSPRSSPVPASVLFSVGPSGGADVGVPRSLRGVSEVMVTSEPDGGSLAPTHSPVIIARLS